MADAALLSIRTMNRQADLYVGAVYPHEAASSARAARTFEFGSRWILHMRARGSSAHAVEQMRATIMQMKGWRTSQWLSGSRPSSATLHHHEASRTATPTTMENLDRMRKSARRRHERW